MVGVTKFQQETEIYSNKYWQSWWGEICWNTVKNSLFQQVGGATAPPMCPPLTHSKSIHEVFPIISLIIKLLVLGSLSHVVISNHIIIGLKKINIYLYYNSDN